MEIFWIWLSKLNRDNFIDKLKNPDRKMSVFTPNPEIMLEAKNDIEFRKTLNMWDYLIPDWIWLYIGFQIMDSRLPYYLDIFLLPLYWFNLFIKRKELYKKYWDRICWSDLTLELIKHANKEKIWVTIIDKYQAPWNKWDNLKIERQNVTVKLLKEKLPHADFHMYIYKDEDKEEIIKQINSTKDVYLFSSQWLKIQEETINNIFPELKHIKVAIWIWWSFDMILWFKKRAPKIFIWLWLEWLWRLIINPSRMLKRVKKALITFPFEVIKYKKNNALK